MASPFSIAIAMKLVDNASRGLAAVTKNINAVGGEAASAGRRAETAFGGMTRRARELGDQVRRTAEGISEAGEAATLAAAAMGAAMYKTLGAYSQLEAAQTSLRVAMMETGGRVATDQFTKLSSLAQELGRNYMGSTEDFYRMFRVLYEQGISSERILGGVGRATADFATVTGEGYTEAALKIAKFQDALGIASGDMVRFADQASKARFAFGVDTQEIYQALPYMASGLKALGLQGVEASGDVLKLIGVLSQAGLPATAVGTSIGQLVGRLAEFETRLGRQSEVMKQVRETLAGTGIDLEFWTAEGKFVGIEAMIGQFEKLDALNPQQKLQVMEQLFGEVAGRAVAILGEKGTRGWAEADKALLRQADLGYRVGAIQETLSFKWDSFTGTVRGFTASLGGAIERSAGLKFVLDRLNDAFDYARRWIENNRTLATVIGTVLVATTALAVGMAALGGAVMVGGSVLAVYATAWKAIGTAAVFTAGKVAGLTTAIRGAIVAVRGLSLAFLATPVGWIVLALAGAALLIVKFWGPISGFFRGLWAGIREGLQGLEPAWGVFRSLGVILTPVLAPLRWLWSLIAALLKPLEDTGGAAENMGLRFGRAIGGMLSYVLLLPARMLAAGANIINSLWQGMMSVIERPVAAVKAVAQRIRNLLPFSPAREGPFRDIHRIRLIETVAEAVKPAPLVAAMRAATAAAMIAATPVAPAMAASPAAMAGSPAGGGIVVHFSPVINVAGGDAGQIQAAVGEANRLSLAELEKMMNRVLAQQRRRTF